MAGGIVVSAGVPCRGRRGVAISACVRTAIVELWRVRIVVRLMTVEGLPALVGETLALNADREQATRQRQ